MGLGGPVYGPWWSSVRTTVVLRMDLSGSVYGPWLSCKCMDLSGPVYGPWLSCKCMDLGGPVNGPPWAGVWTLVVQDTDLGGLMKGP